MIFVCAKENKKKHKSPPEFHTETHSLSEALSFVNDGFNISIYRKNKHTFPNTIYLCKTPFNYHEKEESFEDYLANNRLATLAVFETLDDLKSFRIKCDLLKLNKAMLCPNLRSEVFMLPAFGVIKDIYQRDAIIETLKTIQYTELDRLLLNDALSPDALHAKIYFTFVVDQLILGHLRFDITDFFEVVGHANIYSAKLRSNIDDVISDEFTFVVNNFFTSQVAKQQTFGLRNCIKKYNSETEQIRQTAIQPLNKDFDGDAISPSLKIGSRS